MSESIHKVELPFVAGFNADDQPVFESLEVELLSADNDEVRLLRSPLLTRNLAAGDKLKVVNAAGAEYELLERSGNLSIRVLSRENVEPLEQQLTPKIEKLGGALDHSNSRALVYTIHVSIGFKPIEDALNDACAQFEGAMWNYGNVYDPEDGTTPMEWWIDLDER